jgi:hypothetical protein
VNQRIGRQGGWAGLLVILIALLIAAYLYKDSLKAYGLLPAPPVVTKAGTPGERARTPGAIGAEAIDMTSAPIAPRTAIDRAYGMGDMVKQQAEQRANQGDGSAR